jgi:hypothetical protein
MKSKRHNPKFRVRPTSWNKASSAETALANQQSDFYKTLTADYKTQFANQSAILSSLQTAFDPILKAGINQYGFSPQEDTSMRTSASDSIARNFAGAQTALNENLASRGGGNTFLPSGATAQLQAGLLGSEATTQAETSNAITQKGYDVGRTNFLSAEGALAQTAGLQNPLGYAGAGNQAGSAAFNSADIINQQNTAWQGALGGMIGGAASAFLGNSALGSIFKGGGSGGGGSSGGTQSGAGFGVEFS